MTTARKPSLFIGSSVEGLSIAYALQQSLEYDADPTVWTQGVFNPTAATLHDLISATRLADFAAFIFTPDDIRIMREERGATPRDNVVFELGLFVGVRGPDRCFFLTPRDAKVQLPTDLLGLKPLTYMANRHDGNVVASLGPAANEIRTAMKKIGLLTVTEVAAPQAPQQSPVELAREFIQRWNSEPLLAARQTVRRDMPMHMIEDETGEPTEAMRRLFAFLESMADGVLSGRLSEPLARREFAGPLRSIWRHAYTFLAPLNQADEWWDPLPKVAVLDRRWNGPPE